MWANKSWVFGIFVILACWSSSVEAASVATVRTVTTGHRRDLLGVSSGHVAGANHANHAMEHSSGDDEEGSGDAGDSGTTEEEKKTMSTGSIAAIVIASIAVIAIVGISIMSCVLSSGMGSSTTGTGASEAALAGTGASYGKKIPSLVISAEALAGKQ